jgi:hypothetical protein
MSYSTRVLLWRDFFDDELVLFATGAEPEEDYADALPRSVFGFEAYHRVARATRDESLFPVEISMRFYNEDEK